MLNVDIEDIGIPLGYEGLSVEKLALMFANKLGIQARMNALVYEERGEPDHAKHKHAIANEYDQLAKLISMGIIK